MVCFSAGTNDYDIIQETVCALQAYECVIHSFLEFCRHICKSKKTSFESIRTSRFATYDVKITVFSCVVMQFYLTICILQV